MKVVAQVTVYSHINTLLCLKFPTCFGRQANSYNCTQLTPRIASVVPPEDGRLTPETCR
jgi:hypothetical protein